MGLFSVARVRIFIYFLFNSIFVEKRASQKGRTQICVLLVSARKKKPANF